MTKHGLNRLSVESRFCAGNTLVCRSLIQENNRETDRRSYSASNGSPLLLFTVVFHCSFSSIIPESHITGRDSPVSVHHFNALSPADFLATVPLRSVTFVSSQILSTTSIPVRHITEHCIITVEMRAVLMYDKELRACAVLILNGPWKLPRAYGKSGFSTPLLENSPLMVVSEPPSPVLTDLRPES